MTDDFFRHFTSPQRSNIFLAPLSRPAISYAQAFESAGRFAGVLAAHGVGPGDRVAVQVEKSPEALFLYLACLRAGAIYLPLNTGYTAHELDYFINDARPRLFICAPKNRETIAELCPGTDVLTLADDGLGGTLMDSAKNQPAEFADVVAAPGDLAAILYTSGTTGRSKGAMLTRGNLASNAMVLKDVWKFTQSDVLLHVLPVFHIHGLFVATNVCMAAGASMIFLPKFDVDEIFRNLPGASCMMGVPTFYVRLLHDPRLNRETTKHIRLFISGSAPLLAETHAQWFARTGHHILERYGMTETNMNTSNPYDGRRVPGSVGFPLPGTDLRIADDSGVPLAQGEIGMIEVRGPNIFKGYWQMPEKTKAEFRADGYFITGDLGRVDKDGYVYIVGRGKDLVITGGYNVYPREIETLIDAVPGVQESAVIGLPHGDFGEGVTAVVIQATDASLSETQILSQLDGKLAKFKMPKRVLFVEEFPRNTMGKIQKNLLREKFRDLYA